MRDHNIRSLKRHVAALLAAVLLALAALPGAPVLADFRDGIRIRHPEAVQALTGAGVIDGYNAGNFRPAAALPLPPGTGMLSRLSYSFPNSRSGFGYAGGYRIPLERYQLIYGDSERARSLFALQPNWGGNCFGMSATAALFQQSGNSITASSFSPAAAVPYALAVTDRNGVWGMTLRDFIEAMQVAQIAEQIQWDYRDNTDLTALCAAVRRFQNGLDKPVVIAVFGEADGVPAGHAVLGYALEGDRLLVYDSNYPGDANRALTLLRDGSGALTGWSYALARGTTWSSAAPQCRIAYVPYDDFFAVWEGRAEKPASAMAVLTANGDVTVRDRSGAAVAHIRGGTVQPDRDGVCPIRTPGLTADGAAVSGSAAAWLPAGSYIVEREPDSRGTLELSLTQVDQSVKVSTDAGRVTLTVSDATATRLASLGPSEAGKHYAITLRASLPDSAEPGEILAEGTVSRTGVTVGRDSGALVAEGASEITVDGRKDLLAAQNPRDTPFGTDYTGNWAAPGNPRSFMRIEWNGQNYICSYTEVGGVAGTEVCEYVFSGDIRDNRLNYANGIVLYRRYNLALLDFEVYETRYGASGSIWFYAPGVFAWTLDDGYTLELVRTE